MWDELFVGKQVQACSQGCRHPHGSARHESGNGPSTPGRSPLPASYSAECLFQVIVRPGQIGDLITEKEMRRITVADLEKGEQGCAFRLGLLGLFSHENQLLRKVLLHRLSLLLLLVAQHMSNLVDHLIERAHRGKQGLRSYETFFEQLVQSIEFDWQPLF